MNNDDFLDRLYTTDADDMRFIRMQVCSVCNITYPHSEEFFSVYYRNGKKHLRSVCRSCRKVVVKRSYTKHRDARTAKMRERYRNNKGN